MHYIFFDLEFNGVYHKNGICNISKGRGIDIQNCPQEIIEIGAVRTNKNLEVLNTFKTFVKPKIFWTIDPLVQSMTGITDKNLKYAPDFKKAIGYFKKWLGINYYLLSWGMNDVKELKNNLKYYGLDDIWVNNHIDIQRYYMKSIDFNQKIQIGLERAIDLCNINLNKDIHKALNDAFYAYEVYKFLVHNYDMGLIKKVIINEDEIRLHKLHDINKEIRCIKCGRFLKNETVVNKKRGCYAVSTCNRCNLHLKKCRDYFITQDGNIDYNYRLDVMSNEEYENVMVKMERKIEYYQRQNISTE